MCTFFYLILDRLCSILNHIIYIIVYNPHCGASTAVPCRKSPFSTPSKITHHTTTLPQLLLLVVL